MSNVKLNVLVLVWIYNLDRKSQICRLLPENNDPSSSKPILGTGSTSRFAVTLRASRGRTTNNIHMDPQRSINLYNNGANSTERRYIDTGKEYYKNSYFKRGRRNSGSHQQVRNRHTHNSGRDFWEDEINVKLSLIEQRILDFLNIIRGQNGVEGELVFIQKQKESPTVQLQNSVQCMNGGQMTVTQNQQTGTYELKINHKIYAEGIFPNKKAAVASLCEDVVNKFREYCFTIIKKENYEEVSVNDLSKEQLVNDQPSCNFMEGSVAQRMMLKMGWGGKGLGSHEQGEQKTVAETLTEHITKEGLGNKNVMEKVKKILVEFVNSYKLTTLAFSSEFSKAERANIHTMALKYNLKSKSEGTNENRRITISKKMDRWDLIKELLRVGGENEAYKLVIPEKFKHLWSYEKYVYDTENRKIN